MHSRDFEAPAPVDVILHEQIGHNLVDEDMVENVVSLRDRVLAKGGIVLPSHFALYADPVQLHADRTMPFGWEHRFHDLDFSFWFYRRPLWDIGLITLSLGGLTSSLIGLCIGFKRLFRGIRRIVSQA